ncbi:MAG: asparagine synthase (glutamine-hydrolyzing), partial [Candidatus Aenigmatarchaeota archaeon]
MCGIVGIVGEENRGLIQKMCDVIKHRGPDDSGFYIDKDLSLGVRRLSIIDVSGGKQPIHNEDETVWVIYNGEIYNFLELKGDMERRGHKFYTRCDTEIFVHAYEEYGDLFVENLRGMFAFALWDAKNKKLIIGRDRLGKKPLYYTMVNNVLIFGSEIKSILLYPGVKKAVNPNALHHFLTLQYVPGPETMFMGIQKLQPGNILVYQNGNMTLKSYWDIKFGNIETNENSCTKMALELLKESVKIRLMSEVPLGVYLSGGLDSSSVVGLMSQVVDEPIKTFTVGFGQPDDEFNYAKIVAEKFNTEHKELMIQSDLDKILPKIVWHFDEPVADPAALPTYQMSEVTKQHATVILVGEGGDEAFAGYSKYSQMISLQNYSKILKGPIRSFIAPNTIKIFSALIPNLQTKKYLDFASDLIKVSNDNPKSYYKMVSIGFDENEKQELYNDVYKNTFTDSTENVIVRHFNSQENLLNKMLAFDFKVWLCDKLLMKVDKMTMAFSIEARTPFLDHKLIEFINTVPVKWRLNKYVLRKAMVGILPKEILKRKKHAFRVPVSKLLKNELKDVSLQTLDELKTDDTFNYNYIKDHILRYPDKLMHNNQIWNLMFYRLWYKTFIERDD